MRTKITVLLAAVALMLSACARDMASDTYTTSATGGKVLKGTIISTRVVTIKEHDKLAENTTGGLIGGVGGGVAGANIGSGNGSVGAAVGGAVLGAIAGALAEDALSTSQGVQYIVQIDGKHARKGKSDIKRYKSTKANTKGTVKEDINNSIDMDMESDIVSVVQKSDPALSEGARVYVIYQDDRPRLSPMKQASN